ncbi:ER-Golgi trafficking TRAPP I complex 85 kDa subunit domain-containing protein [Ditylenchus destructor]|nr:ER-Golgi trafficking TRAPP I complex 85 kDa subunit domain-containing protein [Ditylenchus destructor]
MCSPLMALLTSPGAEASAEKNRLSFADMLSPFSTTQITIKDPNGQQVNTRLRLDIRDIRKNGFLLSHTVLPHVLHEATRSVTSQKVDAGEDSDAFSQVFCNSFLYWFEPAEHDYLRAYLCCIFVVSTSDIDPMEELNRLQYQQHLQQHGGNDHAASGLSLPPHCAPPKWMLPNILKFYVLVQDLSTDNEERYFNTFTIYPKALAFRAKSIFSAMQTRYGGNLCHLLRVNSADNLSDMPDPWARILEQRYKGLHSGLELAKRTLLIKSQELSEAASQEIDPSSTQTQFLSTVSPSLTRSSTGSSSLVYIPNSIPHPSSNLSLFTTSSAQMHTAATQPSSSGIGLNGILLTPDSTSAFSSEATLNNSLDATLPSLDFSTKPNSTQSNSPQSLSPYNAFNGLRGQCLDAGDRERIRTLLDEFTRNALVPYVEKQLAAQNETLANRRTIGKSFTSVRKWLSAASSGTTPNTTNPVYGPESSESQTRCLADLAFQFGLYSFALQLYQSLKKDFANDQAWLHHAGALEMAAFASFLASFPPSLQGAPPPAVLANMQKNYPQSQPMLALRCAIISAEILNRLELYSEAATQLIRLNTAQNLPSELFGAILLEHASFLFQKDGKLRRMAFYAVLAGHRYSKTSPSSLRHLSLSCYQRALPLFLGKGWDFAEDHILYTLTSQHEFANEPSFAVDCASRLLRPMGGQSAHQQAIFLSHYLKILRKYFSSTYQPITFRIPIVNHQTVQILHGNSPNVVSPGGSTNAAYAASTVDPEDSLLVWEELENAAVQFHNRQITSASKVVCTALFSDKRTDNESSAQNCTPPFEPVTVQVEVTNPLAVPLIISIPCDNNEVSGDQLFKDISEIDQLTLQPSTISDEPNSIISPSRTKLDLSVTPTDKVESFAVDRIEFDLCAQAIPIEGNAENNGEEWLTVSGFVQLEVKGKRLFATKEQRISKTYAADNRLQINVCRAEERWPLLDFRMASTVAKKQQQSQALQYQHVNAYSNQIYQIITEIDNVGTVDVEHLYLATNRPDLVSLSQAESFQEDSENKIPDKWSLCEAHWVASSSQQSMEEMNSTNESEGILLHRVTTISPSCPCAIGQTFSLRLAFRAPSAASEKPAQLHILFFYIGANGATREFRYRLSLSTQDLLSSSLRAIRRPGNDVSDGLCVLNMRNLISTKDSMLARIELQKLSLVVLETQPITPLITKESQQGKGPTLKVVNITNETSQREAGIVIAPISNGQVSLEADQSINYCLYLQKDISSQHENFAHLTKSQSSSEIRLTDTAPDIPKWSHLVAADEFAIDLKAIATQHEKESSLEQTSEKFAGLNLEALQDMPESAKRIGHLRLAVLWKANITNSNGTVATVFGENLLSNPFANDTLPKGLCTMPTTTHSDATYASPQYFILTNSEMAQLQRHRAMALQKSSRPSKRKDIQTAANFVLDALSENTSLWFQSNFVSTAHSLTSSVLVCL